MRALPLRIAFLLRPHGDAARTFRFELQVDGEIPARVTDVRRSVGAVFAQLAFALQFLRHHLVSPRVAVHDGFARGIRQVGELRRDAILHRGVAAIHERVVQRGDQQQRMCPHLLSGEGQVFVVGRLVDLFFGVVLRVERDAIHVLDVAAAPPARHQGIARGAAIFVGEDHAVLQHLAAARHGKALVPRDEGQVGEAAERVGARIEDGSVRQRDALRIVRREHAHVDLLDVEGGSGRGVGGVARERDAMRARADRSQEDAVGRGIETAGEHDVLVVIAIERERRHGCFAAALPPGTDRRRLDVGDGFTRRVRVEAEVGLCGRARGEEQDEKKTKAHVSVRRHGTLRVLSS